VAADPAVLQLAIGRSGLPDIHALEVGAVGLRVADVLDDGDLALLEQLANGSQGGVKAHVIVKLDYIRFGDADGRAHLVIELVGVGHDRVQAVVSAAELADDQDCVVGDFATLG